MIRLKTINQVEINEPFQLVIQRYFSEKLASFDKNSCQSKLHQTSSRALIRLSDEECKTIQYYTTKEGWEKFITRMKQLSYKSFEAVSSGKQIYLKAVTDELIVDVPNRFGRSERFHSYMPAGKYNIGQYAIYIPYHDLQNSSMNLFHFIPLRKPLVDPGETHHPRHLHHYARLESSGRRENPLTYDPRTCWGNFGSIVSMTLNAGDIPELFRALNLFLTIQNPASPLVWPSHLGSIYERIAPND
jgi:hypothetical protein